MEQMALKPVEEHVFGIKSSLKEYTNIIFFGQINLLF